MTPNEIKEEVGHLALENKTEVEEGPFWSALNRAVRQIDRLRPITKTVDIYNRTLPVIYKVQKTTYSKSAPFRKEVEGCAACYFNILGDGNITIEGKNGPVVTKSIENNGKLNEYRFIIPDSERENKLIIALTTSHIGVIYGAVFYAEIYSDEENDVPSGEIYNVYNLKDLAPDLVNIERVLYSEGGSLSEKMIETQDFALPGKKELWLLKAKEGKYRIYYQPAAPRISVDSADEEIMLDSDLQTLVPLLVAYYVWLEDKPELAREMYTQYMQNAAEIKLVNHADSFPAVQNVYGW